jgi:hypothetical protein
MFAPRPLCKLRSPRGAFPAWPSYVAIQYMALATSAGFSTEVAVGSRHSASSQRVRALFPPVAIIVGIANWRTFFKNMPWRHYRGALKHR